MSKITESARGRECQVRLPGICNWDNETTVFAHVPGAGMALKTRPGGVDLGAYCCSSCHDEVDRRTRNMDVNDARRFFLDGVIRTLHTLSEEGIIKCA